jgi:hypothetical protein
VEIDGMYWGDISAWKDLYEHAIDNQLQVAENALSTL